LDQEDGAAASNPIGIASRRGIVYGEAWTVNHEFAGKELGECR
jgi:hypothetical protein